MAKHVRYQRIYDEAPPEEGTRVLADRIWPRGMKKQDAHLDEWIRDIAPSTELRHWYSHEPEKYEEFRRRYLTELRDADHQPAVDHLKELASHGPVTLLTATRDLEHSQAAVLADRLSSSGRTKA